ncbi:MAG: ABC transporter permease [Desulfuromusa sp.]|jgi:putative ABC transport system permease protein|nr:ABC transporter permease [Desulfuromusa sp.]
MTYYAFAGALEQGFAYGFLVLGVYLTFRVLDFPDLTVDGSLPLGAAVSAVAITAGYNPFLSLLFALIAGFLAGTITGILNTKLGILHLLASILTMIALYSINLRVMGRPNMTLLGKPTILEPLTNAGIGMFNAAPLLFGILSILALLLLFWLLNTAFGLAMQATGVNRQMITSQGVNTDRVIILTVGLSNGLAAVSGALLCQSQGAADVNMGVGTIVAGLASVIVGETLFGCRTIGRALFAALLGSLIYRLTIALALSLKLGRFSFTPSDLNLLTALLVVGALTLPKLRRKVLNR